MTHPVQTGSPAARKPGEAVFAVAMVLLGGVLLWSAYGISGFEALSAAGSVPMAAATVMAATATAVLWSTLRRPSAPSGRIRREILPGRIVAVAALLVGYALLLEPVGFLPTSLVFLVLSIRLLSRRGWGFALLVSFGSLVAIWVVFRLVFTVLMPSGLFPEAELIQWGRDLLGGG